MSNSSKFSAETRRLSTLATSVSGELRQRHGTRKFYSADEVDAVCIACEIPHDSRQYAVAMFVEPEQTQSFLQRLGSSKTAAVLRKFMADEIFSYYLPRTSSDADSVDFHKAVDASRADSDTFHDSGAESADGGDDGD